MLNIDATNLPRFMNCNGSRLMPPSFPTIESDPTARNEGNAAHWLAQQFFNGIPPESLVNSKAYNGVIITSEMMDHVDQYLCALDCGEMEAETSFGGDEWRVNARCDHRKYNATIDTLFIDDFKYGWRIVEPEQNWTLLAHAIGSCLFMNITPQTIVLRIHQPRPHHPDGKLREWRLTYEMLREYYQQIAATLTGPSDELRTGLEWCAGCHALATCPAARKARMNAIDAADMVFTDDMPGNVLSYELDTMRTAKAMLDAQLNALEEMAAYRLKNGAVIENYAMENQYANTRWKTGISPQALTLASGIDCIKPGAITPAEFKRRGGAQSVYDALTERPLTGIKLIRGNADQRARRVLKKGTINAD